MKQIIFLLTVLFSSTVTLGQRSDSCKIEIKGVILEAETNSALPYVKVQVKGSEQSTITDIDGQFHLTNLCDEFNVLIISCFGYCDTTCEHFYQHNKTSHIYMKERVYALDDVVISVETHEEEGINSVAHKTLDKEDLSENPTQTLAGVLSEVEGVTFTSVGNNVQLPVIHGLYGNRILILNKGIKHGFQNWGSDHAPEIDVSLANKITVIKGSAGVRYGPEALGGAIVIEGDPLNFNEPLKGSVGTGYQTNGKGYYLNSEIGQGLDKWSYHLGANYTRIGDRHTPDYSMTNSGKEEKAIDAEVRYNLRNWDFKVAYSYLNQNLALLRSSVAESGNAFVRAINSNEPIFIRPFSYEINEPNQLAQHHLGKLEVNWWYSSSAKLTFRLGKQLNKREEYDVRRNADRPIIDLDLVTNDYQLEWKHPDWLGLDGLIGLQSFSQDNDNNYGTGVTPFIPNYNVLRYSGFIIESISSGKNMFEVGARLDYEYNNVRGREINQVVFTDQYSFTNMTSSLGYVRRISDSSSFRTNIGTAWRTPNMAELYSFGQHGFKTSFGLLRYYTDENGALKTDRVTTISDSQTSPEKGYKWINEFKTEKKTNIYTVTAYGHYIQNYIFNRPIAVVGTFRGPMPVYVYDQTDALFIGADFSWQKEWSNMVNGTLGVSYLWSKNLSKDETLINQPPTAIHYNLAWKVKSFWKIESSKFSIKPRYTFTQFQAPRTVRPEELIDGSVTVTTDSEIFDFKDAPQAYFLLDVAWSFRIKNIKASVAINNLLDTNYRDYLNEMRYFSDEIGRNFLFTIKYKFNSKSKKK